MNLPKLPRQPIRPDKEPDVDQKIWYPDWQCFCCHDSGFVIPLLAKQVIPDYNANRDKKAACYRCEAGSLYSGCEEYDQRFNRLICKELDKIERDNWYQTIKAKQQRILNVKKLAQQFAMSGVRDRSSLEELEAQRRHQETCNAAPVHEEQLEEWERGYLEDGNVEQELL